MSITQAVLEALESLNANKLRSGLTILGIVIGVAAVIAMLAAGTGAQNTIFPADDYLRLNSPENLAFAVEIFQDIRLIPDPNDKRQVHEDLLGWAYDVFLRGKYDGSGGLATYLTPSQVTECMAQMAFHDISDEEIWAGYKGIGSRDDATQKRRRIFIKVIRGSGVTR